MQPEEYSQVYFQSSNFLFVPPSLQCGRGTKERVDDWNAIKVLRYFNKELLTLTILLCFTASELDPITLWLWLGLG